MPALTKERILAVLHDNKATLVGFGVVRLELFGSHARGDQQDDSDVDLLVEFAPGRGLFRDFTNLHIFLEEVFGRKVDLVKHHLVRREFRPAILDGPRHAAQL